LTIGEFVVRTANILTRALQWKMSLVEEEEELLFIHKA
jgi:hypothetical protein